MTTMLTSSLTLAELGDEFLALDDLAAMDDGEWTDAHEALAQELVSKAATKADAFGSYLKDKSARAAIIAEEEQRLADRRKRMERHVERLKRYAVFVLERIERPKIEGTLYTLALQKNPPTLDVTVGADQLPDAYVRVIPERREIDRKALLDAVKGGAVVDGVALAPATHHLRVR